MLARILFCVLILNNEVLSWTVDLQDVRRFLFEKNDRIEENRKDIVRDVVNKPFVALSNRYDSNSKYFEEPHEYYARDYEYTPYIEKKVQAIPDGGQYLEGLRRSLENFEKRVQDCQTMRMNAILPSYTQTTGPAIDPNTNTTNPTPQPTDPSTDTDNTTLTPDLINSVAYNESFCRGASRVSEHVRRLAALATKSVEELQDLAYSRKHMKDSPQDLDKKENEQILLLSWFLERLSFITGYRPKTQLFDDDTTTTTAPPLLTVRPTLFPPEVTQQAMDCLKRKSDIPVTVRCLIPVDAPAPENVSETVDQQMTAMPSDHDERRISPEKHATSEQEVLIANEERSFYYPHRRSPRAVPEVKTNTVKKRDADKMADNPVKLNTLVNYFIKHKVWEADNAVLKQTKESFDVDNKLHILRKRDLKYKIQENPYQDLSKYVKLESIHYVKDETIEKKIKDDLDIMNKPKDSRIAREFFKLSPKKFKNTIPNKKAINKDNIEINNAKNNDKIKSRLKRSIIKYENDVDKPKPSQDIFQDISYYVKNKAGTNYNNNLLQSAQVRAGLEVIFQNPNIEIVRRYGANYNPAILDPFLFGAARSTLDS